MLKVRFTLYQQAFQWIYYVPFKFCLVTNFPEKYVLDYINGEMLEKRKFDVEKIQGLTDKKVQTFVANLHDVVQNSIETEGTTETYIDTLVDDLLRITNMDEWPLRIK